ncbi:MAG: ATP-binding cassette domain-containing protein [Verrucomicrobiaceae bacterium]|nr:ATP-binding cassette domain-containing protein [Verrucomicrobiaceae bacterium]
MWGFVDCSRYYFSFGVPKVVLHDASLVVETHEKLGLLVPPGAGKTTIIRMLAGVDQPNSGQVLRDDGGVPLGYGGAFQAELTGEENIRNVGAIAGVDPLTYSAFCADFADVGEAYFHPLKTWTRGMRGRLVFAASLGLPASTYLADDKVAGGDRPFFGKCMAALRERLKTTGLILVASNPRATGEICERHAVVIRGKIIACSSHKEAADLFALNFEEEQAAGEIAEEELASFDLA